MEPTLEEVMDSIDDVCNIYEKLTAIIMEHGYEFIRMKHAYGDINGIQEVLTALDVLDSVFTNVTGESNVPKSPQCVKQVPSKPPPVQRPVSKQKFHKPKMFKTSPRMFFTESNKQPVEVENIPKETVLINNNVDFLNDMMQQLTETVGNWNVNPDEMLYDDGSFSPKPKSPPKVKAANVQKNPRRVAPRTINVGGVEIDPNKRVKILKLKRALTDVITNQVVEQLKDLKLRDSIGGKLNSSVDVGGLNLQI